jgi:CubicO group peptidase (beta-lactamase class C family)/D-alanyl-D-alanine dipeptidase
VIRAGLSVLMCFAAIPVAAQPVDILPVIRSIKDAVAAERADKAVPSIAVALVDRSGVIWSDQWGSIDADGRAPATARTRYRAGSVSKLLTDMAVMRLVEQRRLDLDAPVTRYLPTFRPRNPYGGAITLRLLMTHRSGLVREAPRGHYFDAAAKGQSDAVASLNATTLVAAPGSITKYSNAGIAVVGEVVAAATGKPFAAAVEELVLRPAGMSASSFARPQEIESVAYAQMASFDGGRWSAPTWDLGTPAAGSLYTTATDLGRFATALLNDGRGLVSPATLAEMWREQFSKDGARSFGLGFVLGSVDGMRSVGHGGAVYGHVATLTLLPDEGVGVIAFATIDSGTSAQRIASHALRSLLAHRRDHTVPDWPRTAAIGGAEARSLAGRFVDRGESVNLRVFDDRLVIDAPELAGEMRRVGMRVVIDDAQSWREDVAIAADGRSVTLGERRFVRADLGARPPAPSAELAAVIGEYGWDYNVLRIYERDGRPYVRIEWTDWLPLTRLGTDSYAFPEDRGLYPRESLRFERDRAGIVTAVRLGAIRFPRRDFGAEAEASIRSSMSTGISALRSAAKRMRPPVETDRKQPSDLVAIRSIDPSIALDVRYAGTSNFMGQRIYEQEGAFLQRPATAALKRVQASLQPLGLGLLIHDAYRPWYVTRMFWDATPPASRIFVADPAQGSRHNRGAAVDLTLRDLGTGLPVQMTGRYDEFSSRSFSNHVGGTDEQRWLRETLRSALEREGFTVYPQEWWHFDLDGWRGYPISNQSFAELDR